MRICTHCRATLLDNARFCHQCGEKVELVEITCPHCKRKNPVDSPICYHCGYSLKEIQALSLDFHPEYPLDFTKPEQLEEQIKAYFFKALKQTVSEEQPSVEYGSYVEFFYQSGFARTVATKSAQLMDDVVLLYEKQGESSLQHIDKLVQHLLDQLVGYFTINVCRDINKVKLPEQILNYQHLIPGEVDLKTMMSEYLDFSIEKEKVYTDIIKMPVDQMQNALSQFLHPSEDEKILVVCDQSIFGTCKEGFALTNFGIYWKLHLEKAHKVYFHELKEIRRQKDWIVINGHFFNVNLSLNIKMLKLLKKLQSWY